MRDPVLPNRLTVVVVFSHTMTQKVALPAGRHGHIKPVKPVGQWCPSGMRDPMLPNRLTVLVVFSHTMTQKVARPAGRHGHVKPDGKLVPFGHARPYVT